MACQSAWSVSLSNKFVAVDNFAVLFCSNMKHLQQIQQITNGRYLYPQQTVFVGWGILFSIYPSVCPSITFWSLPGGFCVCGWGVGQGVGVLSNKHWLLFGSFFVVVFFPVRGFDVLRILSPVSEKIRKIYHQIKQRIVYWNFSLAC